MMKVIKPKFMIAIVIVLVIITCSQQNDQKERSQDEQITSAVCVVHPTKGSSVNGIVKFASVDDGIKITADVEGLTPGKHGFHIHEFGDCSGLDGKSAGGHFNPDNKKHGAPDGSDRHVGDLGNLVAGEDGTAHYEWTDTKISFSGINSIIGRAIIIHSGEDDFVTQPTGNAGARLGYGVIGIAK